MRAIFTLAAAVMTVGCFAESPKIEGGETDVETTSEMPPTTGSGTDSGTGDPGDDTDGDAEAGTDDTGTDPTTDASSETGTGEAVCGDGHIDADEQCDDANDEVCDGCESCELRLAADLDAARESVIRIDDVDGSLQLTPPFTVEFWARVNESTDKALVGRRGTGNTGWRLVLDAARVTATVYGQWDQPTPMDPGDEWHHVAWTYDGLASIVYVDGEQVSNQARSAPVSAADKPVYVGLAWLDYDGTDPVYHGSHIDEIRVSSKIRYVAPFSPKRRHEPDADTLLLLHLDGDTTDVSDHEHEGTSAALAWVADEGYGRYCE